MFNPFQQSEPHESNEPRPLEMFTEEQLIEELRYRNVGILILLSKARKNCDDQSATSMVYDGGIHYGLGLAHHAVTLLTDALRRAWMTPP